MSGERKLVLCAVDALRADMLHAAVAAGVAPNFAELLRRGRHVDALVSSFPSVTPVASAEITTGVDSQRHRISGMNWFHRGERRYVEYGSSFEATRRFGLFTTLYDTVYNMNLSHLSPREPTIFERFGDAGVRSACTPFLVFRGRARHEVSLDGLLRRVAEAASFRHAVWGPDELFYGELYSSMDVPCKPTLARPGTRDEYSACAAREMAREERYEALLLSLPDNDYHCHLHGPTASLDPVEGADAAFGELVEACGGTRAFYESHAVILLADHAQTDVDRALPLAELLGARWNVLEPNSERLEAAELAVSPTSRAANVYVLGEGRAAERRHEQARSVLREHEGVELVAWLAGTDGKRLERPGPGSPDEASVEAVVESAEGQLRFRPGGELEDLRGARWSLEGELSVLAADRAGACAVHTPEHPDAFGRLWAALRAPHAGDLLVSAAPGFECVDWGGVTHLGGGSHGSLRADDSLAPLVVAGLDDVDLSSRAQWRLTDVAALVLEHFGLAATALAAGAGGENEAMSAASAGRDRT